MSAVVLPFPAAPRLLETVARPQLEAGDVVVICVNAALALWCAWPVALTDDDGVVLAVRTPVGKVVGVDRMNTQPEVYGFRAADHFDEPFRALLWKTWRDPADAVLAFAAIARVEPV